MFGAQGMFFVIAVILRSISEGELSRLSRVRAEQMRADADLGRTFRLPRYGPGVAVNDVASAPRSCTPPWQNPDIGL